MKSLISLAFVLAVAALSCQVASAGAKDPSPPSSDLPQREFSQGLLWKVQKPGAKPSYVFGTVHLSDKRLARLPGAVRKAISRSKSLALEMAIAEDSARKYLAATILEEGMSLRQMAGEELSARAAELMAKRGTPPETTARMKPWAVMQELIQPENKSGDILDRVIYLEALRRGKPVYSLERIEEQTAAFDAMPLNAQIGLLKGTIENQPKIPQLIEKLLTAYGARDLAELWEADLDFMRARRNETRDTDAFVEKVLDERSARMAERMLSHLKQDRVFVAVGAAHLYGGKGVLGLLRKKGYSVTRVY